MTQQELPTAENIEAETESPIGDNYWEQFTPKRKTWTKKQRLVQAVLSLLAVVIIVLSYEYYISRPIAKETVLTPMLKPLAIGDITLPTWQKSGIELPLKHTTPFTMVMLWEADCPRCLPALEDFQRTLASLGNLGEQISITVIMRAVSEEKTTVPEGIENVRFLIDTDTKKVPYRVQYYPGNWLLSKDGEMIAYRDAEYPLGYWQYPAVQNAVAEWITTSEQLLTD